MSEAGILGARFSTRRFIVVAIAVLFSIAVIGVPRTQAATFTTGKLEINNPAVSFATAAYSYEFDGVSLSPIKCITIQYTTALGTTSPIPGMNTSATTFDGISTYVPTPGAWTVDNSGSANDIVKITNAAGETPASTHGFIATLHVTNGSTANTTYYAEVSTYNNVDCATSPVDSGTVAFSLVNGVVVTATVDPTLTFIVSTALCPLGTLSPITTATCSHTISAGTNAASGYSISYLPDPTSGTLTSSGAGHPTITAIGAAASASATHTEQFGINLVGNTTPTVGTAPSGGTGAASTNYDTSNQFAFDSSTGHEIANAPAPSDLTTFTVSYIANISTLTEAGSYSTVVTYNIVANY